MTSDEQGMPDWGVTEAGAGGTGGTDDISAGNAGWPGVPAAGPAPRDDGWQPPDPPDAADDQDDAASDATETRRSRRRRSFWRELPVLVVVALVIALLIKTFVVQAFFIPSSSMENTLLIGDKVLVNKLVYHFRKIEPGDVVVFDGSGSWDPVPPPARPSSDPLARLYDVTLGPLFRSIAGLFGTVPGQTDFIKRVIGVPGDRVVCCNAHGQVTVNGVPLQEQSYLYPGANPSQIHFSIIVPAGRLWVMGDNRAVSDDSRLHQGDPGHGTVPESAVTGRAFMIVWPPSRWRVLSIPSTFTQTGIDRAASPAAAASTGAASTTAASTTAASSAVAAALARGVPVAQSAPYLPLAAGFATAIPLTWLQRRVRLRISGRRRQRRR